MSNQKLTIVARITAKEGKVDLVKAECLKLISVTRAEQGCISYDLHQDNTNPNHFMFYENWENRDLWQAHTQQAPLKAFSEATEGAFEEFVVNEMTYIE